MTPTRVTFEGLSDGQRAVWYGLVLLSILVFAWGTGVLVRKYRRGKPSPSIFESPVRRLGRAAIAVVSQATILRRQLLAGAGHALIFYGFVALFVGTAILAVRDDVVRPVLGVDFWSGRFYLGYSLVLDVGGVAVLAGAAVMIYVRAFQRPFRLDYRRADRSVGAYRSRWYIVGDWIFVGALIGLVVTGFLLEAFRIAETNPSYEAFSPVGWTLAQGLRASGLSDVGASQAHLVLWWVHGIAALAWVSSIPFTKALHMVTSPSNLALGDRLAGKRLPAQAEGVTAEEVGYGQIADLSKQHLLSLDACTRCGRCHAACPATASGYPLSPRDLVLDLREIAEGSLGIRSVLGISPQFRPGQPLVGDQLIRPETVWSCMQCMACVEACPVGIEHVPIINQLRRRLVENGETDSMLQSTFERIASTGNSFGEPRRKRARWVRDLPFPVKDIRAQGAELLWFVGDYASLDPRNQRVSAALARLLHHAGADFGILYEAEETAGCDVRRAGEEGLWSKLAEANIATLSTCRFDRIFSSDPHTFHTLKNEYPALGGAWNVLHHTQLMLELIDQGRLSLARKLDCRVTYHDPCALGRYNGVYDAPRRIIKALGLDLVEMPRNRENSFCCGAGGGRIWMTELRDANVRRPSEQRVDEAVALGGISYFVVACPKDVTMYEDAIKTSGNQGRIELREITELVAEAVLT